MKIIHFDLGTNMAFAHNANGAIEVSHFVANGPRAVRAAQILDWLTTYRDFWALLGVTFDVVHYERPFARGYDATRCGWGIAGLIEATYGDRAVVLDTDPQSIKSYALGSAAVARGRKKLKSAERRAKAAAEKLAMIARAKELGYTGDNEHEADAFLGLKYAETYCRKEPPCASPTTPKSQPSTKSSGRSTRSSGTTSAAVTRSKSARRKQSRKG